MFLFFSRSNKLTYFHWSVGTRSRWYLRQHTHRMGSLCESSSILGRLLFLSCGGVCLPLPRDPARLNGLHVGNRSLKCASYCKMTDIPPSSQPAHNVPDVLLTSCGTRRAEFFRPLRLLLTDELAGRHCCGRRRRETFCLRN